MLAATVSSKAPSVSSSERPAGGKTQQPSASNHCDDIFIRTSWADAAVALAQIDKVGARGFFPSDGQDRHELLARQSEPRHIFCQISVSLYGDQISRAHLQEKLEMYTKC